MPYKSLLINMLNEKRTFKKHLCAYNSFVYSILSVR